MSRTSMLCTALAISLSSLALVVCGSGPAHAATCRPTGVAGDVDRDGRADLVVGDPYADGSQGAVEVVRHSGQRTHITRSQLPGDPGDEPEFGTAVAVADLTGDGCLDLAISSPGDGGREGEDVPDHEGDPPDPGTPALPTVFIVRGTPTGFTTAEPIRVTDPEAGTFTSFADDIAVLQPTPTSPPQLVVGMSTRREGRGGVAVYGFDGGRPGAPVIVDRSSPGVDGSATARSYFGESVATSGRSIVVGAPGTRVAGVDQAGSVTVLTSTAAAPRSFTGRSWSQDSAGVPGGPEVEDGFGYSVAAGHGWVAVGVPTEDLDGRTNPGAVQLFQLSAAGDLVPRQLLGQNTAGIPDSSEDYDRFGESVTIGLGLQRAGVPAVLVTSPLEARAAPAPQYSGAWTVVHLPTVKAAGYSLASPGVPGHPAADAGYDMEVSALAGPQASAAARRDAVVVGIPNRSRGRVLVDASWRGTWQSLESSEVATSDGFGAALG
ncbi:FG-GAP repeat domain-containing protein [Auraticoccus monumenti]|uniref:Repeat domain-containing protein n=1 Tax=Auraticoccus monumenti TaxID=675864 RepID=A0A1G7D788_9ACTN|nr:VCBS repeat-containing protein [Auraticoccus monumenti]SDE47432.1 Repeat domain-containing protein [Auraticoccus monumenti]